MHETVYEWDAEEVAAADSADYESGEVIDHFHGNIDAVLRWSSSDPAVRIERCLVRDTFDGRSWAYIENDQLPETFTDATGRTTGRVPKRFKEELRRAIARREGSV